MMKIVFIYPGNKMSLGYQGDDVAVAAEFAKNLDKGHGEYKFAEICFDIQAIAVKPNNEVTTEFATRQANSNYDLTDLFSRIDDQGSNSIDGIILASHWNKSNIADFGQFGARDYASKIEIISRILERYPELAGMFVALNGFLFPGHEIEKWATEFFDPCCRVDGNTCRIIQHFSDLRYSRKQIGNGIQKALRK